jgi:PPOX class probable F420-dependent enzyme
MACQDGPVTDDAQAVMGMAGEGSWLVLKCCICHLDGESGSTVSPPMTHVDLLERPIFSHLATVRPDGSPQSNVMWFDWDGEPIRFANTKVRQKFRNLVGEPWIAVWMHDPDDPYRSLEVRGVVDSIVDDSSSAFYRQLAVRYGINTVLDDGDVRVVVTVRPTRFIPYGPAPSVERIH